jgi:hypothetical protein
MCAGIALVLVLGGSSAFAATITVVSAQDSGPGSLRDAIETAAAGDTVDFALPLPAAIAVDRPLTINTDVTITGPGASSLTITPAIPGNVVVFLVNAGATVTISGVTIARRGSQLGGGVFNAGTLTLADIALVENRENTELGGAIFNSGTLHVIRCSIVRNSAFKGGGIYNFSGDVTIDHSDLAFNTAPIDGRFSEGGGIFNRDGTVLVRHSTVRDTGAVGGGGIANYGKLTVTQSSIVRNLAVIGGGMTNSNFFGGPTLVTHSTIAGNVTADTERGGGGGIFNGGDIVMINSTVWDNFTIGLLGGGGILNHGTLAVSNSTIAGNSARAPGDGGGIANPRDLFLRNSILANNGVGGNCGDFSNVFPFDVSLGHNISDDATCAGFLTEFGDLNSTLAGLVPGGPADNGGPTLTIALLETSPAIGAIKRNACLDASRVFVFTDQRGIPRPQGVACDIGAFEFVHSRFEQIAVQASELIGAVESSPLAPGQQQGLIASVEAAIGSLRRGQVEPAISQLGAFVNHASALEQSGTLTTEEASALTAPAQTIIETLSASGG